MPVTILTSLVIFLMLSCSPAQDTEGKTGNPKITFVPMFNLEFDKPLWFGSLPGKSKHYLVLEQDVGRIQLIQPEGEGWKKTEFFQIDVRHRPNEMGLLGLAFHPDFVNNRKYYINYNPPDASKTYVDERVASDSYLQDSGQDPRRILDVDQPYSNHNGGCLKFGPDGYLYIGLGDGGSGGDPKNNGQDSTTLLGAMLRIDVDNPSGEKPYGIPDDNPFVSGPGAPEIFAYGLRNPWRYNFDPVTGELWVGDVGQIKFEEIDIVSKGDNMGWNIMEGFACYRDDCNKQGLKLPVADFNREQARSITGGYVYRKDEKSSYYGKYIFGDYETRNVWSLENQTGQKARVERLGRCPASISSFGLDENGNLYAVGHDTGLIYRIDGL